MIEENEEPTGNSEDEPRDESQSSNEEETGDGHSLASDQDEEDGEKIIPLSGMYEDWFLDYASYVILERAVPALNDGLKPVQRRILHSLKELDEMVKYSIAKKLKIVTTEKDYFRIKHHKIPQIQFLSVKLEIENKDKFEKELIKCLF